VVMAWAATAAVSPGLRTRRAAVVDPTTSRAADDNGCWLRRGFFSREGPEVSNAVSFKTREFEVVWLVQPDMSANAVDDYERGRPSPSARVGLCARETAGLSCSCGATSLESPYSQLVRSVSVLVGYYFQQLIIPCSNTN